MLRPFRPKWALNASLNTRPHYKRSAVSKRDGKMVHAVVMNTESPFGVLRESPFEGKQTASVALASARELTLTLTWGVLS